MDAHSPTNSPTDAQRSGPPVTQKDVADRAGVSRAMVSYVLNDGPRSVAPETRERVLKAIADLGYRPNKHAQNLMREQWDSVAKKELGLILPDANLLLRPYYGAILAGIYQTAHQANYRIRFMRFFDELKNPVLFNQLIHREEISGLILMSLDQCLQNDEDRAQIDEIRARMANIVCVEWQLEGLPSVWFDRAAAAFKATKHLIGLGHARILYLGQIDQRVGGYQQALRESGLPEPFPTSHAFDAEGGYQAIEEFLAAGNRPQAIVAGSDEVAFGILRGLRERQLAVPQDVALASIDNIDMSAFAAPPLTTINVPKMEMGQFAVEVLDKYARERAHTPVMTLLPINLVVRESCGAQAR